jgi:diguanylate cyclase (GGDEF)-like protein
MMHDRICSLEEAARMHNLRFDKELDFQPRMIDHAGAWLSQLSYGRASALVVGLTVAVCALDYTTMEFELCIATLYVIPISIACWFFGSREGLAVTIAVSVLAFMKYPMLNADPKFWIAIYNGAARMVAFVFIATIVLGARRVFAQMHYLAHRDRITGVLNKVAFNSEFDSQLTKARSSGDRLLLTFIDLDGFKLVNDQFGHDAGDTVLRTFTDAAAKELRASDRIGRLGGDEFATLMIIGDNEDGHKTAQRLHRQFSEILKRSGFDVTCSMGALIVPAESCLGPADLLREADRLMYAAKNNGKNAARVGIASNPEDKGALAVQSVPNIRPSVAWVGAR